MVDKKRRIIELLPTALQTETMTKFFAATVDHLLQPESVEFQAGYIGSKPSYYNSTTDYYASEPTKTRRDYQLPITATSVDLASGIVNNIMFYDDIVGLLKFHGANVSNHSRLFDEEYYSWAPPIDLDKLLNYTKYLWVPDGPSIITLLDQTDVVNNILGKATYVYNGTYRLESNGKVVTGKSLTFSTGLTIKFSKDVTADYNDVELIVSEVGIGIQLNPDRPLLYPSWDIKGWDNAGWNGTDAAYDKYYTTIARNSVDKNQWSLVNRWFHEDVLKVSETNILDVNTVRAKRPIIEFQKSILLYDYGWYGRNEVDIVINDTLDGLGDIIGQPSYTHAGIPFTDGMRILLINDSNPNDNNRVYEVGGLEQYGVITLTLVKDGQNSDGSPAVGDRLTVRFGDFGGANLWFTPLGKWKTSGQQINLITGPLFETYDIDGNSLQDPIFYPNSSFAGNPIFGYTIDANNSVYDAELGFNAKRDQFGSFIFTNNISDSVVTYSQNNQSMTYEGYQFYFILQNGTLTNGQFGNGWHAGQTYSRQYIVNDYENILVADATRQILLDIDQMPAPMVSGLLPTVVVQRIRNQTQVQLKYGVDYVPSSLPDPNTPKIIFTPGVLETGDRVIIKTWNTGVPVQTNGYYELPINLTANPNNKDITTISQSQLLQQFRQIIENQAGFIGNSLGNNNYRDTPQNLTLGLSILQHRAPMLKLMLTGSGNVTDGVMNTSSTTDPMLAMQYAQREYLRFYGRLLRTLVSLSKNGYQLSNTPDEWLTAAFAQINLGKTQSSPWANSGYDLLQGTYCSIQSTSPTYIPPTPTRLGITPAYHPRVYYSGTQLVIETHDGARILMEDEFGNPLGTIMNGLQETTLPRLLTNGIARAWLQFELNMFNNMPEIYKNPQAELVLDPRILTPGKWRVTDYTRQEYIDLLRPMFDRWIINTEADYSANTTFNIDDQFTWNYTHMLDQQGQEVPGNWRGIYRWYYDTDRPHTHPWEMLGFTQEPAWWTSEYGPAPYTNGNTKMWNDLRDGIVRQGDRIGTWWAWSRPGLLTCIPVDSQGNLLPPLLAGTVISLPSLDQAKAEWIFGDGSPIESVWWHSLDGSFAVAQSTFLMKPARFIEYCWDTPRSKQIFPNTSAAQWMYVDTNSRRSSNQFYVHRENPVAVGMGMDIPNESNLTYFGSCGMQHWISEYLISRSLSVTNYFGNLIRGGQPRLGHKVGAFINSSNNSLRFTADSFGNIGYPSQMVPTENYNTFLYRSTSIGTSFYGGVIVKKVRKGWQVYGYDGVYPFFNIIPSNTSGPKVTNVIGNQQVTWYKEGLTKNSSVDVVAVPYGTIFGNRQEVYDLIISYGRWLESQGWQFDSYNYDSNNLDNFVTAAGEFVFWSQANWANGNFIALSPLANSAKFVQPFGNIEFVGGIVAGTYPVLDRAGQVIETQNLETLRFNDELVVRSLNEQSIYGLRLFRTTLEHAIIFDNMTSFGDTVYDDLYNIYQPRLKMYAYRTNDWTGRLDAPGYFLYQNPTDNTWTMIANFEKTADDIRKYFNIDQPKNFDVLDPAQEVITPLTSQDNVVDRGDIAQLAKHTFGYQRRDYLDTLILEESTQFQFYQGFIRQKGTKTTIDKILRNTAIVNINESFTYYEEWALRLGRYGSVALNTNINFIIPQDQYINSPQQINVFGNLTTNRQQSGVIELIRNDPKFVVPPDDWDNNKFPLRDKPDTFYTNDLPTAGYVKLGETDYYVANAEVFGSFFADNNSVIKPIADRSTIWQFIDPVRGWNVWQFTKTPSNILYTIPSSDNGEPTTIVFDGPPELLIGDTVTLTGIANVDVLNGTFIVTNISVADNTIQVDQNTFIQGKGGDAYGYLSVRFNTPADRDANPPLGGWKQGDMAWVDSTEIGINGWAVYQYNNNQWDTIRQESYKVNASLMLDADIYSNNKGITYSNLVYYDPVKGYIPGIADVAIDLKSVYDPAKYTNGDTDIHVIDSTAAWSDNYVGKTWWDLSAVRYIDYEQSDESYRWKNWGKIAPGTFVQIYEWVRSPVQPNAWASYVASGTSFTQFGLDYIPAGQVKNASNPAWTQTVETDSQGNVKIWYYFWVTNSDTLTFAGDRMLSTFEIANIISNPGSYGIPWYAAIDQYSILVANIGEFLNSYDTVMRMIYTQKPNDAVDHKDWVLVRDGDPYSAIPDYFWRKLHDSLIGFDSLNNSVPDLSLNEYQRYGNLIRPRQSWFKNRTAAAKIFVDKANELLSAMVIIDNPEITNWTNFFYPEELIPDKDGNWDYVATSLAQRNSYIPILTNEQKVLVGPTLETNYRWVIYQWTTSTLSWTIIRVQQYRTPKYWQFIDWYDSTNGVSSKTTQKYTVDTPNDLSSLSPQAGDIAKILNNGSNAWELYIWLNDIWQRVALQGGTIEILSSIYDGSGDITEYDDAGFDTVSFDINPWLEFGSIFNGLRFSIFGTATNIATGQLNTLFFTMLNYVMSEQTMVDWAFKTSYITLNGFNNPLYTGDLYQTDNVTALLNYVNEARPYHVKVREFISGRTISDDAYINLLDYDKPPYEGRILNPNNPNDANILATDSTLKAWYDNYQTNPNLIRNLKTTLVFDRVASIPYGWDTYKWNTLPWSQEAGQDATFGAFDRIQQYYSPTPGMIPILSDELIGGTAYKGVILSGLGLNLNRGWATSAWDSPIGWNPTEQSIEDYIDIIVQGGVPPVYDTFYVNGLQHNFTLSRIPQDVAATAVWSNNALRVYGAEWIIPNWITDFTIIQSGTGYSLDETLYTNLPGAPEQAEFKITGVSITGQITGLRLVKTGKFDLVPSSTLPLVYAQYHVGAGNGVYIQPVWGGDTVVFKSAPAPAEGPSVYVLFSGETFAPALDDQFDIINDGYRFIQPTVAQDHAEELYNARLQSVVRLDTYSNPVGGYPIIYTTRYQTDGVQDQFDLVIKPQNEYGVIAILDGVIQEYGIANDYVINFYTNKLVFISPPAAGLLQLITISHGGSGTSITKATVVNPGYGFNWHDIIEVQGGGGELAQLVVSRLKVVSSNIIFGGSGYKTNDLLILNDDGTDNANKATLIVQDVVPSTGQILSVSIYTPGTYEFKPNTTTWNTSGSGIGADIQIEWGVDKLEVLTPGFYTQKPDLPASPSNVIPLGGQDLTFNLDYTYTLGTDVYFGNGISGTFDLSFGVSSTSQLMVTVDGVRIVGWPLTLNGNKLTIFPTPGINSVVVITGFTDTKYSVVTESSFTILAGQNFYNVTNYPASTQPQYEGVIVLKNNQVLQPPPMNNFIADGVTTVYIIEYVPPFSVGLFVYVDNQPQTENVDFTTDTISNSITFTTAPARGAKVTAVVTNQNYGYEYAFAGPNIEFPTISPNPVVPGDIIRIISFTEDLSYGWLTDKFAGNATGEYTLLTKSYDTNNIFVLVDGIWQNLLYDYLITNETVYTLLDATDAENDIIGQPSYTYTGKYKIGNTGQIVTNKNLVFSNSMMIILSKDLNSNYNNTEFRVTINGEISLTEDESRTVVKFNDPAKPASTSSVVITYATGLADRPPIAWRTTITSENITQTIAIDDARKTTLLSNVYVSTTEIEIEDITKVTQPSPTSFGSVWIGNELIRFEKIQPAATITRPNRGILQNILRGSSNTSWSPVAKYNTLYYYGDNSTRYFPTESGTTPLAETVYVNNVVQIDKAIDSVIGTYEIVIDPVGYPAGRYVVFDVDNIPSPGYRNVRIAALNADASNSQAVHKAGDTVIDAGDAVRLPGGYTWEPAPLGLQYSNSVQANFLKLHSGTRS